MMQLQYLRITRPSPAPMGTVLFIFSFLFISGCITHFKNALTEPGAQKLDSRLYGTWGAQQDNEPIFIHIGKEEKTGLLRVAMVEFDKDGKIKISQWSGHTSRLGKRHYLNLKWVSPEENKYDGYLIIKYETTGDHFKFYFMDDTVVEKAVKEGRLRGNIIKDKWTSSAWVSQDQKSLQQFILSNDERLFKESYTFPRLKVPPA
jgi:hypothetical protein